MGVGSFILGKGVLSGARRPPRRPLLALEEGTRRLGDFGWALAWVSTVTLAIIPRLAAYNQLFLMPALIVLVARFEIIKKTGRVARALVKGAFLCQVWQWAAAFALSLCALLIPASRLRPLAELPMYTSLASRPVTLLAVALATFYLSTRPIPAAPRV